MIWRKSILGGTVVLPFVVQSCNVLMASTVVITAMKQQTSNFTASSKLAAK
jgi:hypothetical protein